MTTDLEKERMIKFIRDEVTANAVYNKLRDTFLKKKGARDVNLMAAERLAVDLLEDAWSEMSRMDNTINEARPIINQVGL